MALVTVLPGLILKSETLAGGLAMVADLAYRMYFARKEDERMGVALIRPAAGGQFFFIPVWLWGLALLTGFLEYLGIT